MVVPNDPAGERQANAPPVTLRAESGLEDPVAELTRNARTGIRNTNTHLTFGERSGRHVHFSIATGKRIFGWGWVAHSVLRATDVHLCVQGEGWERRLQADFGLARRASNEAGSMLKGTTKYMAPETVSEQFGPVGARCTYAMGSAFIDAAEEARQKLFELAAPLLDADPVDMETVESMIFSRRKPSMRFAPVTRVTSADGTMAFTRSNTAVGTEAVPPSTTIAATTRNPCRQLRRFMGSTFLQFDTC